MARLYDFPSHLGQFFRNPPEPGNTHRWLLSAANKLRKTFPPEVAASFLHNYCRINIHHRDISLAEVQAAVARSLDQAADWKPNGTSFRWPDKASPLIEKVLEKLREAPFDLAPKCQTKDLLPRLFRPGELVCMGPAQNVARILPLEEALDQANGYQFIVPNPMKAMAGTTKDGRPSARCQDNVLLRRHLITEIDDPGLTLEAQSRIILFLRTRLQVRVPLTAVVHSGGKSLHAWWNVEGLALEQILCFFSTACLLGADPSLWDIAKWVRMPGGIRLKEEKRLPQPIVYGGPA